MGFYIWNFYNLFFCPGQKKADPYFRENESSEASASIFIHLDLQLYPVINLAIVMWTWDKFCSKYLYFIFEPSYESKQHALQLPIPILRNKYEC
jgi:hypothetical protein